jgi:hypothetical protein
MIVQRIFVTRAGTIFIGMAMNDRQAAALCLPEPSIRFFHGMTYQPGATFWGYN